jgi:anaerobic magnesium-protoporphyrin IX monomethyl ester cyclase
MGKGIVLIEPGRNQWQTSFAIGEHRADPIALGYLSSSLRQEGYNTSIIQQRGESDDEIVDHVVSQDPRIVGISAMTYNFNKARKLAVKLKRKIPNTQITFGGYHVSAVPKECLSYPEVDYVIVGEGEETFIELAECVIGGDKKDLSKIRGLAYKTEEGARVNPRRERIKNLDYLPFPDRYGLEGCVWGAPIIPIPQNQISFAQVTYSRGCYHQCTFCTSSKLWRGEVVHRSAKNLVDEIEFLVREYGTNGLFFTDLTFNADRTKVIEFCDEMDRRHMVVNWMAACRITEDLDLLRKMRDVGCVKIAYGVESLDNSRLHELGKGTRFDEIINCFEATNNLGIITRAYIMMGYPDENECTVRKMKQDIKKLPADQIRLSLITPFPGTPFFDEMQQKGLIISNNTDDYDTVTPVLNTGLTQRRMIHSVREVQRSYYSDPNYRRRIEEKIRRFPHLKLAYDSFF